MTCDFAVKFESKFDIPQVQNWCQIHGLAYKGTIGNLPNTFKLSCSKLDCENILKNSKENKTGVIWYQRDKKVSAVLKNF